MKNLLTTSFIALVFMVLPLTASAVRLANDGAEFGNVASVGTCSGTTETASSLHARTGTYAYRINISASFGCVGFVQATNNTGATTTARAYVYIASLPTGGTGTNSCGNSDANILAYSQGAGTAQAAVVCLDTTGHLRLYSSAVGGAMTLIGSASSVLSTATWYRVEFAFGGTSKYEELRLDGVVVASTNVAAIGITTINGFEVDADEWCNGTCSGTSWTMDMYYDDIAINDLTGTANNSFPGAGALMRILPNAAGDVNTLATQTGGTAGAGNNFTRVNETPPDDATTFNGDKTSGNNDLYNMADVDSVIGACDVINNVSIVDRFRRSAATQPTWALQWEKAASGQIFVSGNIATPSNQNWTVYNNNNDVPAMSTTTDPTGAVWTRTTLDSMQAGPKITSTVATNRIDVTYVGIDIDFTATACPAGSFGEGYTILFQ